jgi:hypothetical protein
LAQALKDGSKIVRVVSNGRTRLTSDVATGILPAGVLIFRPFKRNTTWGFFAGHFRLGEIGDSAETVSQRPVRGVDAIFVASML